MCVLIFSTSFIWNISTYEKNSEIFCDKCEESSCKVSVIFSRVLMKLEFFGQIFEKYSNLKFR